MISFIVPAYNVEKYIGRCIESLLPFLRRGNEIILVNDGSTDNTLEIIRHYSAKYPDIKVITQINKGLSGARNSGIRIAKGEYIWFIDSDDYVDFDESERILTEIKKNYDAIVFGRKEKYNSRSRLQPSSISDSEHGLGLEYLEDSIKKGSFRTNVWDKIYRLNLIREKNIYFDEGLLYEDMLFNLKYFIYCRSVRVIRNYPYIYNKTNFGSISYRIKEKDLDVLKFIEMSDSWLTKNSFFEVRDSSTYSVLIYNWVSSCLLNKYVEKSLYNKTARQIVEEAISNTIFLRCAKICSLKCTRPRIRLFAKLLLFSPQLFKVALIVALKINNLKLKYT